LDQDQFRAKLRDRTTKIGIVGFGYVGSCLGAVIGSRGFRVLGIDVREALVERVNRGEIPFNEPGLADAIATAHAGGLLEATTDLSRISETDVVLLCVGTPLGDGIEPDTGQVRAASRAMAPHLRPGQLVILKSTAPPGTTEDLVAAELSAHLPVDGPDAVVEPGNEAAGAGDAVLLAFCPERLAEGSALRELASIPVVVGGIGPRSRDAAMDFWQEALGVDTVPVGSPRAAEMVKLADNQWIDLNIALANELALLSERVGVDVLEVIRAANSLPKGQHHVNILTPSMGVGGSCLTKDPWFLAHMASERGIELRLPAAGRQVNDAMPAHAVERIREGLAGVGKSLASSEVAVLGLAFKSNTGDCRFTPVAPALDALVAGGARVRLHDPLVTSEDAEAVTDLPLEVDWESAVRGADCVAFFTGHDAFRELSLERLAELAPGALVMDGRMYFPPEALERMTALGLTWTGIGR
jgi:dTDP-alpha-D-glucose dehydrogenase